MTINEKAKLLLAGACCENCHYYSPKWYGSGNARVKRFCAKYTLPSGQIVKLNTFNENEAKEIDLSFFCDYYVGKEKS